MLQEGQHYCNVQPFQDHRGGISKWGKTDLKWHLDKPIPGIDLDVITAVYAHGFKQWSDVCGLTFTQTMDHSDGDIHVFSKRIDGASGTLAYAFLPGNNTTSPLQVYMDSSERWDSDITDGISGIALLAVFTHELGHIIGLDHLSKGNLLAPYYTPNITAPRSGDISEAVKRYGPPKQNPTPPTDPTDPDDPTVSVLVEIPAGFMPGLYSARLGREDVR